MKHLFTLFTALLISSVAVSQALTFDQLLSLRTKDLEAVEEYLTSKKWSFTEAKEGTDDRCESADFAYEPSDFEEGKAAAFISYYKCASGTRISYQTSNKTTYLAIVNRVKSLGYTSGESKIEDDKIIKTYTGKTIVARIVTTTTENSYGGKKTSYIISVLTKADYDLVFGE